MPENTFNFHATNQQNQIGDNNEATMNVGDQLPTPEQIIEKVAEVLPEEEASVWAPQIQQFAAMPKEEQEQPETLAKITALCDKLKPYAGPIGKSLAVFGATALETLATRSAVVAGIVAVCQANS